MHELGVVFHVIDHVVKIAEENKAQHINTVVLEIGTVSGIVEDYLQDCWKWAVEKHTETSGCLLKVKPIEAVSHCEACGADFDTIAHGKTCPTCGSDQTYLLQGNEFIIKEIMVT